MIMHMKKIDKLIYILFLFCTLYNGDNNQLIRHGLNVVGGGLNAMEEGLGAVGKGLKQIGKGAGGIVVEKSEELIKALSNPRRIAFGLGVYYLTESLVPTIDFNLELNVVKEEINEEIARQEGVLGRHLGPDEIRGVRNDISEEHLGTRIDEISWMNKLVPSPWSQFRNFLTGVVLYKLSKDV